MQSRRDGTVYTGSYTGRLPRINEWHGARTIGGHARIFENTKFKKNKQDAAASFRMTSPKKAIDYPVDAILQVSLWKRLDSDAVVKGTLDALEDAGVLVNDKLIRDFTVIRRYHPRDNEDWVKIELRVTGMKRGRKGEEG